MKRFTAIFIVCLFLIPFVNIGVYAEVNQEITGEVTLVGKNLVRIKDNGGLVFNLHASQKKLKVVSTGYRVVAKESGGELVSIKVIGVPVVAKPAVIIKKTIIVN